MIGAIAKRAAPRIQGALKSKVPSRNIYPQASSNHIAGMPRNKIPFPEKIAAGLFITGCIVATPAYIITHMDSYRGEL